MLRCKWAVENKRINQERKHLDEDRQLSPRFLEAKEVYRRGGGAESD